MYRVGRPPRGLTLDDECRSLAFVVSPLYRSTTRVLHHRRVLCIRLSISCRDGLSQTFRKARVRCRSRFFGSPCATYLPCSSSPGLLRVRSRQLLLIQVSWHRT